MVHKSDYVSTNGTPIINPANIVNGRILNGGIKKVSNNKVVELTKYRLSENDILLARRGDLKKCAIVTNSHVNSLCGTGTFFLHLIFISPHYFRNIYSSNLVQDILKKDCVGATMDNLNQSVLANIFIPIPPLGEQMRINKRLEYYFSLLNLVEDEGNNLHVTIKQAKSKILNLAIHGKLVPQDSTDEPASELLKRINPKAESTCDNPQYGKLPNGWCRCTLKDIGIFESGYAFSSDEYKQNGVPLVRISNITNNGNIDLSSCVYIQNNNISKFIIHEGDLLIAMSGATTGKMGVYKYKTDALLNQRVGNLKCTEVWLQQYRNYFMLAKSNYILNIAYGGAQPNISAKAILSINIDLPPINEQHRIVAKIEELFTLLDNITSSI